MVEKETSAEGNGSQALALKRYFMMLEGLSDIDAGRVVDHSVVEAWAKSLSEE